MVSATSENVTGARIAWDNYGDMMKYNKKIILAVLVMLVILAAGFTQSSGTNIKSQDDVGKAIANVSTSIDSVSNILDDIDSKIK